MMTVNMGDAGGKAVYNGARHRRFGCTDITRFTRHLTGTGANLISGGIGGNRGDSVCDKLQKTSLPFHKILVEPGGTI
jgi:hypothetical protein